jgi:hypothetical protein
MDGSHDEQGSVEKVEKRISDVERGKVFPVAVARLQRAKCRRSVTVGSASLKVGLDNSLPAAAYLT